MVAMMGGAEAVDLALARGSPIFQDCGSITKGQCERNGEQNGDHRPTTGEIPRLDACAVCIAVNSVHKEGRRQANEYLRHHGQLHQGGLHEATAFQVGGCFQDVQGCGREEDRE
jgi:hypothetical protein